MEEKRYPEAVLCDGEFEVKVGNTWEAFFLELVDCEVRGERVLRLDKSTSKLGGGMAVAKTKVEPVVRFYQTKEWAKRGQHSRKRKNRFNLDIRPEAAGGVRPVELSARNVEVFNQWKSWFSEGAQGGSTNPRQLEEKKRAKREATAHKEAGARKAPEAEARAAQQPAAGRGAVGASSEDDRVLFVGQYYDDDEDEDTNYNVAFDTASITPPNADSVVEFDIKYTVTKTTSDPSQVGAACIERYRGEYSKDEDGSCLKGKGIGLHAMGGEEVVGDCFGDTDYLELKFGRDRAVCTVPRDEVVFHLEVLDDSDGCHDGDGDESHQGPPTKHGIDGGVEMMARTPPKQPAQDYDQARRTSLDQQHASLDSRPKLIQVPETVDLSAFKKVVGAFEKVFDRETVDFLKTEFESADDDHNGWLSFEEMCAFFDNIGQTHNDTELRQLIYRSDKNFDGKIDFGELLDMLLLDRDSGKKAQCVRAALSDKPEEWFKKTFGSKTVEFLQQKFDDADADSNGTLDFEELCGDQGLFNEIGQSHSEQEIRELGERYDAIAKPRVEGAKGDQTIVVAADFKRLLCLLLMEPGNCAKARMASNEHWASDAGETRVAKCRKYAMKCVRPFLSTNIFVVVFTAASILWAVVMNAEIDADPAATAPAVTTTPANATKSFPIALLQRHCGVVPDDLHSAFASPTTLVLAACAAIVIAELVKMLDDAKGAGRKLGKDYLACAVNGLRKYSAKRAAARKTPLSARLVTQAERLVEQMAGWVENDGFAKLSIMTRS